MPKIKEKIKMRLLQKLSRLSKICFIFGISGTALSLTLFELDLDTTHPADYLLRAIISINSFVLLIMIVYHYLIFIQFMKVSERISYKVKLIKSKYLLKMILELFICSLHAPPCFTFSFNVPQNNHWITYQLDKILLITPLFRFYLLKRSKSLSDQVKLAESRGLKMINIWILISVLVISYWLRVAETPYMHISQQNWNSMMNSLWCSFITMSTVGYGDFYPSTRFGRIIGVIACILGIFLISLLVTTMLLATSFSPEQLKAYNQIKKQRNIVKLEKLSINLIISALRYKISSIKVTTSTNEKLKIIKDFKNATQNFRKFRLQLKASKKEENLETKLIKLQQQTKFEMEQLMANISMLDELEQKVSKAEKLIDNIISITDSNNQQGEELLISLSKNS